MEARIGEGNHHSFYGSSASDFMLKEKDLIGVGKRSQEWDLNDWKWDGDLFLATPLNTVPSNCKNKQLLPVGSGITVGRGFSNSSSDSFEENYVEHMEGRLELEKRRRVVVVEENAWNDESGSLTLKLGGNVYPTTELEGVDWERKNGKKTKLQGGNSSRSACQVEDCGADLSTAKDYHRRHKVCEMHSKAGSALVGNAMQRFCQQCSRFHLLQEFDDGKRSCRRRLAGHNRRRRKTHPDIVVGGSSLNDDQASRYLSIFLLRILSNLQSNHSDQAKDQDILSHFLRNLASIAGTIDGRNLSELLQASQNSQKLSAPVGASSEVMPSLLSNGVAANLNCGTSTHDALVKPIDQSASVTVATKALPENGIFTGNSLGDKLQAIPSLKCASKLPINDGLAAKGDTWCTLRHMLPQESNVERVKLNNIDLNNIYNESQDCADESGRFHSPANLVTGCLDYPSWVHKDSHQSSPPQAIGYSDSASAQSPSSSNGDTQSRTDRIVFKLFGKVPNDFPLALRAQILDWLSHSPTDIESYIRPGCIILTIYLRLAESTWEELCCNLSSSLNRLLDVSGDAFWQTGWVYARVQHQIAFICNGQVVLDMCLPLKNQNHCRISSVTPIAVSVSERANFVVRGYNLSGSTTRLLCAFEGMHLFQETSHAPGEDTDTSKEPEELQCLTFSCSLPNVTGRGFVEVEDHGLSSIFFPFIVAEQDVCSEIRMLECAIEMTDCDDDLENRTDTENARSQALEFLHEMGWLLRRSHLKSRLDHINSPADVSCLTRFKWVMKFSMDHDWCAVVKKLLDLLFEGAIDAGGDSVELALLEMGLLHCAVRRNCRPMVELLLRYIPDRPLDKTEDLCNQQMRKGSDSFLFRPDMAGPGGVTPLHVAACRGDAKEVLDALTDDAGQVGIRAWNSVRDQTGFSPQDYASLGGYYSYSQLVQKKINRKSETGHVIIKMPGGKQDDHPNSSKPPSFQIDKSELGQIKPYCKRCSQQLVYSNSAKPSRLYRPVMLSMLAVAAVCVCVSVLLKSPPFVQCISSPFRWELVEYGSS
ncbi:squamosa promoter-binding-like protein 1 [Tasmannia lanceolata]|uniref:squamosa promoter-binding-like protein 1 n=1 Tax=Tasmannia lanceolata TaxID=3420 RepID=UPI004063A99F